MGERELKKYCSQIGLVVGGEAEEAHDNAHEPVAGVVFVMLGATFNSSKAKWMVAELALRSKVLVAGNSLLQPLRGHCQGRVR